MQNDGRSYEETARKLNRAMASMGYFLFWGACIICLLIALMSLSSLMNGGFSNVGSLIVSVVVIVIFGGLAYLLFRGKDNFRIEYDYTFTPLGGGSADLDVAKVLGNTRRKLMTSLALRTVEAAGPVNGPGFERYRSMRDVKKHNWFINREGHLYFFYFTKNNVRHIIVLELSEEMINRVKPYFGYGIWMA